MVRNSLRPWPRFGIGFGFFSRLKDATRFICDANGADGEVGHVGSTTVYGECLWHVEQVIDGISNNQLWKRVHADKASIRVCYGKRE